MRTIACFSLLIFFAFFKSTFSLGQENQRIFIIPLETNFYRIEQSIGESTDKSTMKEDIYRMDTTFTEVSTGKVIKWRVSLIANKHLSTAKRYEHNGVQLNYDSSNKFTPEIISPDTNSVVIYSEDFRTTFIGHILKVIFPADYRYLAKSSERFFSSSMIESSFYKVNLGGGKEFLFGKTQNFLTENKDHPIYVDYTYYFWAITH